jgi:hypothetical protein
MSYRGQGRIGRFRVIPRSAPLVMTGFMPGIRVSSKIYRKKDVDGRNKSGHEG